MENKDIVPSKIKYLMVAIFALTSVIIRLLPHPSNFVPVGALALFLGKYFSKKTAVIIIFLTMAASDLFLGFYQPVLMAFVYGSFLIYGFLGSWMKKSGKWQVILSSSVLGSVIFYLLTNFAVWAFTPWYSHNISGLIQSYFMALPFFKNSLMADLFYGALFFGIYELFALIIKNKIKVAGPESFIKNYQLNKI